MLAFLGKASKQNKRRLQSWKTSIQAAFAFPNLETWGRWHLRQLDASRNCKTLIVGDETEGCE
jgi:hypothetical protein